VGKGKCDQCTITQRVKKKGGGDLGLKKSFKREGPTLLYIWGSKKAKKMADGKGHQLTERGAEKAGFSGFQVL